MYSFYVMNVLKDYVANDSLQKEGKKNWWGACLEAPVFLPQTWLHFSYGRV